MDRPRIADAIQAMTKTAKPFVTWWFKNKNQKTSGASGASGAKFP
jgi:hypothetical protein